MGTFSRGRLKIMQIMNVTVSLTIKAEKKEENSYKKQKELASTKRKIEGKIKRLEEAITKNEEEIEKLHTDLNEAGSDFEKITELSTILEEKQNEIDLAMEEWSKLSLELEEL